MNPLAALRPLPALALLACLTLPGCAPTDAAPAAASETADGAVRAASQGLVRGDLRPAWDGLPPSWQKDVHELVALFAQQMDPQIWDRSFTVVGKLARVLDEKRAMFRALDLSQMGLPTNGPAGSNGPSDAEWDAGVGLLRLVATSDVAKLETLATLDVRGFLGEIAAFVAKHEQDAGFLRTPDLNRLRVSTFAVTAQTEDSATVEIHGPLDQVETLEMVRVEGCWVPAEMAEDWKSSVASARTSLASMWDASSPVDKGQVLQLVGTLDGLVDRLDAAKTQADFEAALSDSVGMLLGMMMSSAMKPTPIDPGYDS